MNDKYKGKGKVSMVKNKRLKMSPGGIITLPVAARKALAMQRGVGVRVGVSVERDEIVLTTQPARQAKTWRVSPTGMMQLGGEAKSLLSSTPTRHYWLKLDDQKQQVRLIPFK
ncbi:MAG: hypothetical protein PVH61_18810 [Candidatus Aminicenantes bacterium]|jgi:hypothetical protein